MSTKFKRSLKRKKVVRNTQPRGNIRSPLESNPRASEGTIMDSMDRMMAELADYYNNGGR